MTAGTLTRNGWTPLLSNAPTAGCVRVRLSGAGAAAGAAARISLCTGAAKDVRLDAVGETADVTCAGNTITVRAVSTLGTIEVLKHSAAAIPVTAQALIADTTGIRVALDAPFRFDAQLRAYTLDLEIARLEPGAYSVSFVVLGDPVVHTVAVRVR